MNTIKRSCFYTYSKCQLRCKPCPRYNYIDKLPDVDMTLNQFKKYVDASMEYGITEIELSPMVGEILLDPKLPDMLKYLDQFKEITRIDIFTNGLNFNKDICEMFAQYPKFNSHISIYGCNESVFNEFTNTTGLWNKFILALTNIILYKPKISEFLMRYQINSKEDIKFSIIKKMLENIYSNFIESSTNNNWNNELIYITDTLSDGANIRDELSYGYNCPYLILDTGIWPNGDVGICTNWWDINKNMIIGNVNKESLSNIYKRVFILQEEQKNKKYRSLCYKCQVPILENQINNDAPEKGEAYV